MSVRLHITGTTQQNRIKRAYLIRKRDKAHRQMHIDQAVGLRREADNIEAWLAENEFNLPEQSVMEARKAALDMRTAALEHENGKCMENHA
jgi:hypothetical protein